MSGAQSPAARFGSDGGGVILSVAGRGNGRGWPEAHEITILTHEGRVIRARQPTPQGVRELARRLHVLEPGITSFDRCPICLSPDPGDREHVPPFSIGGNAMVMTCAKCNNEFGSRYEPHLKTWYENSIGKVRLSGTAVKGSRHAGEFLVRQSEEDEFLLIPVGKADPAIEQIMAEGSFTLSYGEPDVAATHLAAVKSAYLAACVVVGEIPEGPRSTQVREALLQARDSPKDEPAILPDVLSEIVVGRSTSPPVPGRVSLCWSGSGERGPRHLLAFNDVYVVDWPLDPIIYIPERLRPLMNRQSWGPLNVYSPKGVALPSCAGMQPDKPASQVRTLQ